MLGMPVGAQQSVDHINYPANDCVVPTYSVVVPALNNWSGYILLW